MEHVNAELHFALAVSFLYKIIPRTNGELFPTTGHFSINGDQGEIVAPDLRQCEILPAIHGLHLYYYHYHGQDEQHWMQQPIAKPTKYINIYHFMTHFLRTNKSREITSHRD